MSSSDDDLPDVLGPNRLNVKAHRLKIDVDAEIKKALLLKETKRKITVEVKKFEARTEVDPLDHKVKEPKITSFPPNRCIFSRDCCQKCFNFESLLLQENTDPVLGNENWIEYFQWLRLRIKNLPVDSIRPVLLYLWFMQSVHPNQHIIFKCTDILLEFNRAWRVKWEEVILLFRNWGVCVSDFVTENKVKIEAINSPLEGRPSVTPYNVESALIILKEQISTGNLDGEADFQRTVFILLTLLSLDAQYASCTYVVQDILEVFEASITLPTSIWVPLYCKDLLKVEQNHARITYLAQCILPSSVRRCISYGFLHSMLSLEPIFVEKPEPSELCNLLKKYHKVVLKWDSYEIHSFISLCDCIVTDYVTLDTDKEIRSDYLLYLRDLSQVWRSQSTEDIDVDATVVCELLSRLETEWEVSWTDICKD